MLVSLETILRLFIAFQRSIGRRVCEINERGVPRGVIRPVASAGCRHKMRVQMRLQLSRARSDFVGLRGCFDGASCYTVRAHEALAK